MKRSALFVNCLAVLALVLAGCGGSEESGSQSDSPTVVRVGLNSEGGSNYDPVTNPNAFAYAYMTPVFDTLLVKDDSGELAAGIATSWTVGSDGTTVTLELRDSVTFHDGEALDAAAVVANLERARTATDSVLKGQLSTVTAVEATADLSVQVTLTGGIGAFLGNLTGRLGMIGSPTKLADPTFKNAPIGAGPWEVSDESVVGETMIYTAYDGYWDEDLDPVDRLEFTLVAAESVHNALLGDQIDIGSLQGRRDLISQVENAGFTNEVFPAVPYQHTIFLRKVGPLADERVRQAISLGLDREEIASQGLQSACTPQAGLQALPGADEVDTPEQDQDAARELLDEAGFSDGVDISVVVSNAGPGSTILQAMQGQLSEIGIRLSINPLARAQLLTTFVGGESDAYFTVNTGDVDPSAVVSLVTTTLSPDGTPDSELNALAAEAANAVEPDERAAAYTAWNERFAETAFAIGLCNEELPFMVAEGVEGLTLGAPLHIEPRTLSVG